MNPENAASIPTLKEQNLRVFQRKPIPGLFFQPRFEPWFQMHKARGTLPDSIRHLDLREVYDFLGASMRTVHYYTDRTDPVQCRFSNKVKITEQKDRNCWKRRFDTPHGPLFDMQLLTLDGAWRIVEFPAKSRSDLRSLEWLFSQMTYSFDTNHFKEGASYIGDRGEPQFWVPKSPYLALAQQWMKFEDFFYALADDPLQVETLMRILDRSSDG